MKLIPAFRIAAFSLIITGFAVFARTADAGSRQGDVAVSITQKGEGEVTVDLRTRKRLRLLTFSDVAAGYRDRRWNVNTPGFKLVRLENGDEIKRVDGRPFDNVSLTAKADLIRIPKNYQPITRYGEGGVMIFTGHFWPMTRAGGRMNATFDFTPAPGSKAVAFGERKQRLENWRSPMAHPAFVYMGPLEPIETDTVLALVDPLSPQWVRDEFLSLTPRAFDYLAGRFGFSLETKPNLFLAAPLGADEGRLSYAGDALPAQFQITLEGAAWKVPSEKALDIFRHGTLHEAVHLWQAAARPKAGHVAQWIHEGAADAIAAESMVALGYWTPENHQANFERARHNCADGLVGGPLSSADGRKDYAALYACGHIIAVAVSRTEGATVTSFWREFIARAQASDGYRNDDFYNLVRERTGDPAFTATLREFVRTPPASPLREIDRLLAAAEVPLAPLHRH